MRSVNEKCYLFIRTIFLLLLYIIQGATLTLVRLSGTGKNPKVTQVGQVHICFMLSDGTSGNAPRKPPKPDQESQSRHR